MIFSLPSLRFRTPSLSVRGPTKVLTRDLPRPSSGTDSGKEKKVWTLLKLPPSEPLLVGVSRGLPRRPRGPDERSVSFSMTCPKSVGVEVFGASEGNTFRTYDCNPTKRVSVTTWVIFTTGCGLDCTGVGQWWVSRPFYSWSSNPYLSTILVQIVLIFASPDTEYTKDIGTRCPEGPLGVLQNWVSGP